MQFSINFKQLTLFLTTCLYNLSILAFFHTSICRTSVSRLLVKTSTDICQRFMLHLKSVKMTNRCNANIFEYVQSTNCSSQPQKLFLQQLLVPLTNTQVISQQYLLLEQCFAPSSSKTAICCCCFMCMYACMCFMILKCSIDLLLNDVFIFQYFFPHPLLLLLHLVFVFGASTK